MKMRSKSKGKGKVHPHSPPPPPPPLSLLPAAVLSLLSALSADDRHVLSYMLSTSLMNSDPHKKLPTTPLCSDALRPNFDCDCFRCYTAFWLRWDSSPNRDLIHAAIEAFEDHLAANDQHQFKKTRPRKKDKFTRGKVDNPSPPHDGDAEIRALEFSNQEGTGEETAPADIIKETTPETEKEPDAAAPAAAQCSSHKGLARKVLPDVMGIFNSRLWSLWNPNV